MNYRSHEDFKREVIIYEKDGKLRKFLITNSICEQYIIWQADEIGGAYHFEESCSADDDEGESFRKIQLKVLQGVRDKSLRELKQGSCVRNAVLRDGKRYILNDSGVARIIEDMSGEIMLVIDGFLISMEEFSGLISEFCNFNMEFNFKDVVD